LGLYKIERRQGMRKMKKVVVLLLALVLSFSFTVPAFAEDNFTVHAKAPSAWTEPGLWAWSAPDGTNVFTAWPGQKLTKDEANEGWFYYEIPSWANSIIINEGKEGGGQTADVSIESKELWITVADDFSYTVAYEAPEGFVTAAAPAAETETKEEAPKTGATAASGLWLGMAALSGIGFFASKRRKAA
jgi:LPXTG-motif cell wall-anchored protein